ncbi:MAG: DUF1589 domain-containing protein [Rhodopirellula sp. JB055]
MLWNKASRPTTPARPNDVRPITRQVQPGLHRPRHNPPR